MANSTAAMVRFFVTEWLVTGSEDSIEKTILDFVKEQFPAPAEGRLTAETDLIEEGIIDSMSILFLVRMLMEQFDLPMDLSRLVWANFQTVHAIKNLVIASRSEND